MRALARPIGLGLAARGDIDDVVTWSRSARDAGLDSIWIHDSYFERDAVSFGSAVAAAISADDGRTFVEGEAGFRVAIGAVNPFTRHPVVLAMTGSALDEMLPGRIVMGLGTGLPLRLKQMGIPYAPDDAVARVSTTIDQLRALWAGERLPSATEGLPPIQPMFPPTHRIPLVIAAYRKEFVALAGQKADGYLARPAESIPSLAGILARLRASATEAGRDPDSLETAGYLLSLVDATRREALNRAKREPFVIYMMSVLGDVSLRRAGFDRELRDRIAAAWRAEDYTTAGNLIPDELLDAFMLCGTREDVAAGAMAFHAEAGLGLPLLQPVVQEDRQIDELIAAAALYAAAPLPAGRAATAAAASSAIDGAPVLVGAAAAAARRGSRCLDDARERSPPRRGRADPAAGRRCLGDPPAVRLHRIGDPGPRRRSRRLGRRALPVDAVPRGAGGGDAPPLRDERRQRDLRRPPRRRHDHLATGEPRPRQGAPHRTCRLRRRLRRVRPGDPHRHLPDRPARSGHPRPRDPRARPAGTSTRRRRSNTSTRPSASPSCSSSWDR